MFAEAVARTTGSMRRGLAEVRELETASFISGVSAQIVRGQGDSTSIPDLASDESTITPKDLTLIYAILAGIDAYAELLQFASGDTSSLEPSQYAEANADRFKYLEDAASAAVPEFGDFGADVVNMGASSIQSLGHFLNSKDISGDVPTIVKTMQPHISAIAQYLVARIGSPHPVKKPDGSTQSPHGLRAVIADQKKVIYENTATILEEVRGDESVKTTELIDLAHRLYGEGIVRSMRVEFALTEIQEALRKMVDAHKALEKPDDPSAVQLIKAFDYLADRAAQALERVELE